MQGLLWQFPLPPPHFTMGSVTSARALAMRSRDKQRLGPQQRHLLTVEIPKNLQYARKRYSSDSVAAGRTPVMCRQLIL